MTEQQATLPPPLPPNPLPRKPLLTTAVNAATWIVGIAGALFALSMCNPGGTSGATRSTHLLWEQRQREIDAAEQPTPPPAPEHPQSQ